MKILFIGDIVGRLGRKACRYHLSHNKYDFVIGNVENSAAGFGITDKVYHELKDMGFNAMTAGNHTWDKKEALSLADSWDAFIRPANLSSSLAGKGYRIFNVNNKNICIINLLGRVFLNMSNCPFEMFDKIYNELPKDTFILVDFHGEATSEKIAFGHYAKGRANVICGTHTHVQTNDLKMIDKNTLYLTDAGMCGAESSVIGVETAPVVEMFTKQVPVRFTVETKGAAMFNGFSFTINDDNIITDYTLINEVYPEMELN
ncbi:MAG: YmdB family metallophosphoesterase [Mucispirillum sp.]|uniref:YmdB family metallophosphoesterase n=1 Tax=Candidatus Mucispirillum faecigallinarum TaxID=2838699 RepID=A0A9D2KB49_9BACT|nr:YmdB family metallophosphoesterase [Mucispirillum sp.]HIZ89390.1 YmdB family metallophosphoesterase [Candidatus Mucispirillum faecigallinarum]